MLPAGERGVVTQFVTCWGVVADMPCAGGARRGAAAADRAAHEPHRHGAREARPPAAGHPADVPRAPAPARQGSVLVQQCVTALFHVHVHIIECCWC